MADRKRELIQRRASKMTRKSSSSLTLDQKLEARAKKFIAMRKQEKAATKPAACELATNCAAGRDRRLRAPAALDPLRGWRHLCRGLLPLFTARLSHPLTAPHPRCWMHPHLLYSQSPPRGRLESERWRAPPLPQQQRPQLQQPQLQRQQQSQPRRNQQQQQMQADCPQGGRKWPRTTGRCTSGTRVPTRHRGTDQQRELGIWTSRAYAGAAAAAAPTTLEPGYRYQTHGAYPCLC